MEKIKSYQEDSEVQKNRWWILVSVAMFTFMSTLDSSIVNIALPTISKEMSVPMNQAEWVVSIYLMVVCACLLLFGKIGDSFGKIKVYRIGTVIFTIGSLLCGFNQSLSFLLFARVVQSIGASMTMATNSGIITEVFPLNERGRALGAVGAFVSLGAIAGPGIGGLILSNFSWSYIFWINVPVGLVTILIGEKFLPKDITKTKEKIDFSGFACIAIAIMTFFGGIFLGQESGFGSLQSYLLFIIAIIALGLFSAVLIFASNFFVNVVIPFYLQDARKLSASYAGLLMMVFPLLMVVGAPLSGYLTDKIGPGILTFGGLLLLCCTSLMYMFLDMNSPIWYYVIATAIMGLGNALFQSPNNTMVMSSVEKQDLGVAGSMNSFARNLGMVIGIALSTTILYRGMSEAYGERVTTYLANRPDIFIVGMRETFFVAFLLCVAAFILTILRFRKTTK